VVAVASEEPFWIIQKNKFIKGETLWILSPDGDPEPFVLTEMWDEKGLAIDSAPHAEMRVRLPFVLPPHSIIRREHI